MSCFQCTPTLTKSDSAAGCAVQRRPALRYGQRSWKRCAIVSPPILQRAIMRSLLSPRLQLLRLPLFLPLRLLLSPQLLLLLPLLLVPLLLLLLQLMAS